MRGHYGDQAGRGLGRRLRRTAGDPQTWRDLAWLIVHSVVGFAFGVAAVSLIAIVLGTALLPAWYWAIPEGVDFGPWTVDTLGEAFASALLAIPAAVAVAGALRGLAWSQSSLARAWLAHR